MTYKVLKHKTLPDTFGSPVEIDRARGSEIGHSNTPTLFQPTANVDDLKKYYKGQDAEKQLDDYDLVEIVLHQISYDAEKISDLKDEPQFPPAMTDADKAVELANLLFNAHHHHPTNERIFYYEDDLLPILNRFGMPAPNWEGSARKYHAENMIAFDKWKANYKKRHT